MLGIANETMGDTLRQGINFEIRDGLLYHIGQDNKKRLCVPINMHQLIFTMAHNNQYHTGLQRTLHSLSEYHFQHKKKLVEIWIRGYYACTLN